MAVPVRVRLDRTLDGLRDRHFTQGRWVFSFDQTMEDPDLLPSGNDKPFALVTLIFSIPLLIVGGAGGGVVSPLTPTIPAPAGPAPDGFRAFP